MKRLRVGFAVIAMTAVGLGMTAGSAPAASYKAPKNTKINVLGEWAHPDDDTSIIGPCGVWHQRYGVKCGIVMVTRGEGGGNAVGTEIGPALGLRRENEDRIAHYRSGTVDIFNIDRVDFFYNTTAPLTQHFWGEEETLRRITRIIRTVQPDIYVGFTPSLNAGHGNHQQAGRYIWEGVKAAADPNMFPEQLRGPHALSTWQVKKVFSGGSTAGTGGTTAPNCNTGFVPTGNDTVAGVWLGYDSPYAWPAGNLQGQPAGSAKLWSQVAREGTFAYPTQSRTMFQDVFAPACSRFAMTDAFVPFQPNVGKDGAPNPLAGRDDAILYGAVVKDPGGLPLGTTLRTDLSSFLNAPGAPFDVTVTAGAGRKPLPRAKVTLTVPAGWQVDRATKKVGPLWPGRQAKATFHVTPAAGATPNQDYKLQADLATRDATGHTETVVRVVPGVQGRFQRWGKWAEYDDWLANTAPRAQRVGYSAASQSIGAGESLTVPVVVHNFSTSPQTGEVQLTLPTGVTSDVAAKSYGTLAPGADTTVEFQLSNAFTNATAPAGTQNVTITTTQGTPAGSSSEVLGLQVVPSTTIPGAATAPAVDGKEGAGEYTGEALDVGHRWEGTDCAPLGVDCGTAAGATVGDPATSTYAKVTHTDDALYLFVHVRDEFQSYAVTPRECVAHWLADSVEILIDPRGTAMESNMETAATFKLGVFPFTNDPSGSNGNGANGPCWERDADNHQGYSTGPLADTVAQAPNAPGVEVASSATWVGTNDTGTSHAYTDGGYDVEVKIPTDDLPAAIDPDNMGLNITPYDNDNNAAPGTTALRHIDQGQTRVAWSAFGSVQSNPYLWGHAKLADYTPPADQPTESADPIISSSNLNGAESPETIAQSARDGVPISGRPPATRGERLEIRRATFKGDRALKVKLDAEAAGTARFFLWSGEKGYIPVYLTSCSPQADPPPDYGFTPCAQTDGGIPPWGEDMSGHLLGRTDVALSHGGRATRYLQLDAGERDKLRRDGSLLVSWETADGHVQAFDVPLGKGRHPGHH